MNFHTLSSAESLLKNHFADTFGTDVDDPAFKVAVLLLIGVGRRKDTFNMARATGYKSEFVAQVRQNLRDSGVWHPNDKVSYTDWTHPILFAVDVLIGLGKVDRIPVQPATTSDNVVPLRVAA